MPLPPGVRLGAYEILGLVGAGGMGEVYRARDTRLDRTVAIKVLSEQFAADPDRRARFEREARAVAALNHSHICALHDVGESPSPASTPSSPEPIRFLVMEYLEGQTLAERLVRGPMPTADALRYAIELADALDHAHRRGLVHRDLKPGNVMLTKGGAKLLDFGLSRLGSTPDLLALSTVGPADAPLTAQGTVLGTFPYMAPEQLMGREADARSDIFAFGALVYEMTTGRRAFEGTTAATVIGAILHTDPPPISSLQPLALSALDRVVSRCLAKDPDDRWQTARDLMLELKWFAEQAAPRVDDRLRDRNLVVLASAAAAIAFLAIVALVFVLTYAPRAPADDSAVQLPFSPPDGVMLAEIATGGYVSISPDGRNMVFVVAAADGTETLWVRPLDSPAAKALPGTDGATYPFWSPDSQSVGFFARGKLKKIAVSGGLVQTLCDAALPRGGTWGRAGVIVFSANLGRQLYRVPSAGGDVTPLNLDQPNRESHWPDFLPDGRHFVYYARRPTSGGKSGIYVASLDSSATTLLISGYLGVDYALPGYLLLLKGGTKSETAGTLMAQRFDDRRLQLVGDPFPIAEQVAIRPLFARGVFAVSDNGILVYGTNDQRPTTLIWLDRDGVQRGSVGKPGSYARPILSPDEKTLAVGITDPEEQAPDIWLMETTRPGTSRLTVHPAAERMPVWSPDGRRIAFSSAREPGSAPNLFQKAANSVGDEQLVFRSDLVVQPTDWSRDGQFIIYASQDPKTQWDLWYVTANPAASGDLRKPVAYLQTPFNEHEAYLSLNSKWMAYASDESGKWEVYVCAFPVCGPRTRISTDGGVEPRWRRDGKELFYVSPSRTLMAVDVQSGNDFKASTPRRLFQTRFASSGVGTWRPEYSTGEGRRFLINTLDDTPPRPVTVILNWPATLGRH